VMIELDAYDALDAHCDADAYNDVALTMLELAQLELTAQLDEEAYNPVALY
jgi:hypothetical protein